MKNIFKSSEFALAMAALAHAPLASQPNATESGAWKSADALTQFGQGLAQQEALKKARKEAKKQKKGALGGSIGSMLGTAAVSLIPGVGPFAAAALGAAGGTIGGAAGSAAMGGKSSLKDSAMKYGLPALADGMVPAAANKLGDLVLKGVPPSLGQNQVAGALDNARGVANVAGSQYDPSAAFVNPSMKAKLHPVRRKLGNMLKGYGSNQNRMTAEPDNSYTYIPD